MNKLLSIICILGGLYTFLVFFASIAGHPPNTGMGISIIPITLLATIALFYTAVKLWENTSHKNNE